MTGIVRPARGRPHKVTKQPSSATAGRRPSRQLVAASAATAVDVGRSEHDEQQQLQQRQRQQSQLPMGFQAQSVGDLGDHLDSHSLQPMHHGDSASSAGLDHQQLPRAHELMTDLHLGSETALKSSQGNVHDPNLGVKAVGIDATVTHSMDLSTAANILANGGTLLDASGPASTDYGSPSQGGHDPTTSDVTTHHHGHHPDEQHAHHHTHHPLHMSVQPRGQHGLDFGAQVRTTEELARESGYQGLVVESALAKRLAREPALRPAQQRRPEQLLNLARRSNVEALFAHIAGEEVAQACKNCHKGHGPWTACVVVDGQMCGSCTNCWFNASGARCSFHETRNPQSHVVQTQPPQTQHHQPLHQFHLQGTRAVSSQEPSAFAVASPVDINAPPPVPPQLVPPPDSINLTTALNLTNPTVRYAVERAMAEARSADVKTRQLMMIDIAAKQLALNILAYETTLAKDDPGPSDPNALDLATPDLAEDDAS